MLCVIRKFKSSTCSHKSILIVVSIFSSLECSVRYPQKHNQPNWGWNLDTSDVMWCSVSPIGIPLFHRTHVVGMENGWNISLSIVHTNVTIEFNVLWLSCLFLAEMSVQWVIFLCPENRSNYRNITNRSGNQTRTLRIPNRTASPIAHLKSAGPVRIIVDFAGFCNTTVV